MNRSTTVIAIGIALAMGTAGDGTATPLAAQEVGPANGSLVVVGGAMQDLGIVRRFIDLAGGPDAPIVVIPTAGGAAEYDQFYPGLRQFRAAGATNLTVIHTNDRDEADSEAFVSPIREAEGSGSRADGSGGSRIPTWTRAPRRSSTACSSAAASSAARRPAPRSRGRTSSAGTRRPTPS